MRVDNGLSNRPRLTQNSYRGAVSETVRGLQDGRTDHEMADEWTVGSGSVLNARNKNHDLGAIPLLKLGERFGCAALDTVMALIGARAVPLDAIVVDIATIPADIARTVPMLIELLADGDCSDADVRKLEDAGAIECFTRTADMLRQRRDVIRNRGPQ